MKKERKEKNIIFRIEQTLFNELKEFSKEKKLKTSSIIREAVKKFLKESK